MEVKTMTLEEDVVLGVPAGCTTVTLNVGGQCFHTTAATLSLVPGTRLASIIVDPAAPRDRQGNLFVDRDPHWFPAVLKWLRDGAQGIPEGLWCFSWETEPSYLRADFEYYGLTPRIHLNIEEHCTRLDAAEAARSQAKEDDLEARFKARGCCCYCCSRTAWECWCCVHEKD